MGGEASLAQLKSLLAASGFDSSFLRTLKDKSWVRTMELDSSSCLISSSELNLVKMSITVASEADFSLTAGSEEKVRVVIGDRKRGRSWLCCGDLGWERVWRKEEMDRVEMEVT